MKPRPSHAHATFTTSNKRTAVVKQIRHSMLHAQVFGNLTASSVCFCILYPYNRIDLMDGIDWFNFE